MSRRTEMCFIGSVTHAPIAFEFNMLAIVVAVNCQHDPAQQIPCPNPQIGSLRVNE